MNPGIMPQVMINVSRSLPLSSPKRDVPVALHPPEFRQMPTGTETRSILVHRKLGGEHLEAPQGRPDQEQSGTSACSLRQHRLSACR
ncbi:hypothetical protein AVEN_141181-1 [Araneus ventricosus]|uniref:Uncharacterized protein n=1 Tax=Araneus ventricosus TaxID=182803 RepID=A0A4Y2ERL7_ARAVE|nr:hypothetical protein AVEN_141181-1 [Araneus ventricosus]